MHFSPVLAFGTGAMHAIAAGFQNFMTQALQQYGYWAVFAFVAIESLGIPFPGETMLFAAAVYAAVTHDLNIALVIVAGTCGAIVGDNIGFWVGRTGGYTLAHRFGRKVGLTDKRLNLYAYLFKRFGPIVVFWGRWVALFRTWAAFVAGINRMDWGRFFFWNAIGGLSWATIYGALGYILGHHLHELEGPIAIAMGVLGWGVVIWALIYVRRNEDRLAQEGASSPPRSTPGKDAGRRSVA